LVSPLDRAIALTQMHQATVTIADDLEFDVMWPVDQFLDIDSTVPERPLRLAAGSVKTLHQADVAVRSAHSPTATARNCFDHHRVSNFLGDPHSLLLSFDHTIASRRDRYPCLPGLFSSRILVAHYPNRARRGPNKSNIATAANLREMGVLREKTVPWMNRIDIADLGGAYYPIDF
jgi:hypothetical protein